MTKILPLGDLRVETYQGISFILAIMLGHKNVEEVYYNNYINLECNITDNIFELGLSFTRASWEDYRLAGLADMSMFYIKNLSQEKFDNFLQERIEQENYIIMYCVDEYYLSYTANYMINHFIHDTYIYGYDEKAYYVLAYKNRKLQQILVPHEEITKALFIQSEKRDNVSFCTFKPNSTVDISINISQIKSEYYDYRYSHSSVKPDKNKVYGIGVYNQLEKCIKIIINSCEKKDVKMDLRPFRCMWEHKKISLERAMKIKDLVSLDEEKLTILTEIECISRKIFLLIMKFNCTNDINILKRSIHYIIEMKGLELQFLDGFLSADYFLPDILF